MASLLLAATAPDSRVLPAAGTRPAAFCLLLVDCCFFQMAVPTTIESGHIVGLAAALDAPTRYTQRCVEKVQFLPRGGQRWTRTIQWQAPAALRSQQSADAQWYVVSLGIFKRRRLPDIVIRDASDSRINLLTSQQHGEVLTGYAIAKYLREVCGTFSVGDLRTSAQRDAYAELNRSVYALLLDAGGIPSGEAREVQDALSTLYAQMLNVLDLDAGIAQAKVDENLGAFSAWIGASVEVTRYLCWVEASPGDIANIEVTYTTSDVRARLETSLSRWMHVLGDAYRRTREESRLSVYHELGLAPLHNAFTVPDRERGASYYFVLQPPENTLVTYLDWQDGNSFSPAPRRLDCSDPSVHFQADDEGAHPENDSSKTVRAYVRSTPRAHKQIAAAALLNLVFIYLVARGRIGDSSSAADWLLLAPSVLLAYIAEQQRHYYAMATRRQRGVLWVYLVITVAAMVTAVFGSPRSSEHWGWLSSTFAWLLVGSSVLLVAFTVPLGSTYEWVTRRWTLRREEQTNDQARQAGRRDFPRPRWKYYEWTVRSYADRLSFCAVCLTACVVTALAVTNWGRTLPTWLGGVEKTTDATPSSHISYVASEAVSAVVVPWSVLLRAAMAPSRADTHVGRHRSGG